MKAEFHPGGVYRVNIDIDTDGALVQVDRGGHPTINPTSSRPSG